MNDDLSDDRLWALWIGTAVTYRRAIAAVIAVVLVFVTATAADAHPLNRPEQQCSQIGAGELKRGTYTAVMRWCPTVAHYLNDGERRGLWTWQNGDLTRLMKIVSCETSPPGDPRSDNPRSSAYGLFQFLDGTWQWMIRVGAHHKMGFDNPSRVMPLDQIAFGVFLAKRFGWTHWRCWRYT